MNLYHLFNSKEVRRFMRGKLIDKVELVRPDKKTKVMYESELNTQAIIIKFTDGTSIQIDTWIGNFKVKASGICQYGQRQRERQLAYLTAMTTGQKGLRLTLEELRIENEERLGKIKPKTKRLKGKK